jgi:copper chaperone CopZ
MRDVLMVNGNKKGERMNTKTFRVPNIGCDGCVRAIKNEVSEIEGVTSVIGNKDNKMVTVEWGDPATWEKIRAALIEIDYAPDEPLMPA